MWLPSVISTTSADAADRSTIQLFPHINSTWTQHLFVASQGCLLLEFAPSTEAHPRRLSLSHEVHACRMQPEFRHHQKRCNQWKENKSIGFGNITQHHRCRISIDLKEFIAEHLKWSEPKVDIGSMRIRHETKIWILLLFYHVVLRP